MVIKIKTRVGFETDEKKANKMRKNCLFALNKRYLRGDYCFNKTSTVFKVCKLNSLNIVCTRNQQNLKKEGIEKEEVELKKIKEYS